MLLQSNMVVSITHSIFSLCIHPLTYFMHTVVCKHVFLLIKMQNKLMSHVLFIYVFILFGWIGNNFLNVMYALLYRIC